LDEETRHGSTIESFPALRHSHDRADHGAHSPLPRDVTGGIFTGPPAPEDVAAVDVWVDPAVQEEDYDGFVAEGMARV